MKKHRQEIQRSIDQIDSKLSELRAEQEVAISYQQKLYDKAEKIVKKLDRNINGLRKRLEPYVTGDTDIPDSKINEFLDLKQEYDALVLLRQEHMNTMQIAEETIAEAQLGLKSSITEGTGKTIGAIVNED
jgi:hypothetical protein